MPDILHELPIAAPTWRVFDAVATPHGLSCWWTRKTGINANDWHAGWHSGSTVSLFFDPDCLWRADVREVVHNACIELQFTQATPDWTGTRVRVELQANGDTNTVVHFSHTGWADASEHYRVSSFCWAMYLRLLKRYVEHGEVVPYESRLDV